MRTHPPSYTYANAAPEKYPRFVAAILDEAESLYFTSHSGIANVPGIVIQNVLTVKDAVSMRVVPDEGRSESGVVNFDLLDKAAAVTNAFRAKLLDSIGLRGKTVKLYHGFAGADFSQFQVFQTQKVASCAYNRGAYAIKCADIGRELRKEIFDPKKTNLTSSISATDTTITVGSTSAFAMVEHSNSYSDGPDATVGYFRIEKEVVRYTGKTSTTFTGCSRGVLNTRAVAHTVDLTITDETRKPEVTEVIYLELPAVKMILAILTGKLYGQGPAVLPDHWHMGIDPVWVRESDFTGLGTDLWDLTSDTISFCARFASPKKTDGKRFLEAELYQLIGCFPIIYADGAIGIKRMNRVLADAPFVAVLDESNVCSWSELTHDMEGVINDYQVQWNYDEEGKSTRTTRLIDGTSIDLHGKAQQKVLKFQGLYGSRHTDATVKARLDSLRDRYAHPPELLTVDAMPRMNVLEVGDIVCVRLPLIRDYPGTGDSISRSMEIQRSRINLRTGEVEFELFGSTGLADTQPASGAGGQGPDGDNSAPDDFYDTQGTDLATIFDITMLGDVGVVDAGTYELTGHADLNNPAAIYYYLGDLTIPDGVTVNISGNVQIRIRGFLTLNGDIDGRGRGKPGLSDTPGYGTSRTGTPGFGSSRAMDGFTIVRASRIPDQYVTNAVPITKGMETIPAYEVVVVDGSPPTLSGLPPDLRGTSGGPGGKIQLFLDVRGAGGTGGTSGAGLCIVSRGMTVGLSGSINLSGADSATPSLATVEVPSRPGAGAPGCPGGFLLVLDGPFLSLPDLSGGRFLAVTGASGAPRINTMSGVSGRNPWTQSGTNAHPLEGYLDPGTTDLQDWSPAAHRIVYLQGIQTPVRDQPAAVPPPIALSTVGVAGGIEVTLALPPFDQFDNVALLAAASNDRSGATVVARFTSTTYVHLLSPGTTRYYWAYTERDSLDSTFYPTGSTSGVSGTAA